MPRAAGFTWAMRTNILHHLPMNMLSKHLRHLLLLKIVDGKASPTAPKIRPNYIDTGDTNFPHANRIHDTFLCITLPICRTG